MILSCVECKESFEVGKIPPSKLVFCPYCGTKITIDEPDPAKVRPPGWDVEVDDGWFRGDGVGPATVKAMPSPLHTALKAAAAKEAMAKAAAAEPEASALRAPALPRPQPKPQSLGALAPPSDESLAAEAAVAAQLRPAAAPLASLLEDKPAPKESPSVGPSGPSSSAPAASPPPAQAPASRSPDTEPATIRMFRPAALAPSVGPTGPSSSPRAPKEAPPAEPETLREITPIGHPEAPGLATVVVAPEAFTPSTPIAEKAPAPAAEAAPQLDGDSERFFHSEVGRAPVSIDALAQADDLQPAHRGGNRTFVFIASAIAIVVVVFLVYLIGFREKAPTTTKRPPTASLEAVVPAPAPVPESALAPAPAPAPAAMPVAVAAPLVEEATEDPPEDSPEEARAAPGASGLRPPALPASPAAAEPYEPPPLEPMPSEAPPATSKKKPPKVEAAREKPAPAPVEAPAAEPPAQPQDEHAAQAQARYRVGQALLVQGNFRGAIPEFVQALRLSDKVAEAHRGLGNAYSALQRKADAIRHFEAYLRARPKAPDRHVIRESLQDLRN